MTTRTSDLAFLKEELGRLVAFPTVSNRPLLQLAAHLAARAEDAGFRVERFEHADHPGKASIVATIGPQRGDGSGLVVSGHMDVVPTEGQPWTCEPFALTERGAVWLGRGVADMKGFLAVITAALREPPRAWKRELTLIWTHDEEVGCLGSALLADRLAGRPLPRACWIGEPTGMRILRMHPGHVAAELHVEGKAAHSSRPDLGRNAIVAAGHAIGRIADLERIFQGEAVSHLPEMERPWVPINVAEVHGGVAVNVVPDTCTIRLGYRHLPGQDPHAPFERIRAHVGEAIDGCPVHGRVLRVTRALLTPAGTPLEAILRPHARDPRLGAATFATDGANLALLGTDPLVFGPGAIEVAHQADEHVSVDELLSAVEVARAVLATACA